MKKETPENEKYQKAAAFIDEWASEKKLQISAIERADAHKAAFHKGNAEWALRNLEAIINQ